MEKKTYFDSILRAHTATARFVPQGSERGGAMDIRLADGKYEETSRQIFKTLVELNRVEIPSLPRIKTTELFRVPIGYITRNLRKYYYDNSFPLSAKNRKIAVLNRELYMELATGYKIVIHDMVSGEEKHLDRKLLVIAMQRTMSCLLRVLYQSVIVYDPFPGNTWRELYKLFAYAEIHQLQDLSVKDDQQKRAQSSIKDIFIQAMLFAIISLPAQTTGNRAVLQPIA